MSEELRTWIGVYTGRYFDGKKIYYSYKLVDEKYNSKDPVAEEFDAFNFVHEALFAKKMHLFGNPGALIIFRIPNGHNFDEAPGRLLQKALMFGTLNNKEVVHSWSTRDAAEFRAYTVRKRLETAAENTWFRDTVSELAEYVSDLSYNKRLALATYLLEKILHG